MVQFDSIPQQRLMERIEERISDGRLLALIGQWLQQDIVKDASRWQATSGTPQGAVISPFAGQHLPAPAGSADDAGRVSHGALCGRLRGSVPTR